MSAVADIKLTARDLDAAIRQRYESPEWHIESEVTLGARRLDLVAMNLWTSRSNCVVGFELKVSRGDWLRELDQFQKSEEWCAVVDSFYVVTPPKLVKDGELPDGWGLLELTGSRMMTRRHATQRPPTTTIPRELAARFIGRLAIRDKQDDRTAQWRASDELRKEAQAIAEKKVGPELEGLRKEAIELRRERSELYRALGVEPHTWRAHETAMRAAGIFAAISRETNTITQRIDVTVGALKQLTMQMQDAQTTIAQLQPTPNTET